MRTVLTGVSGWELGRGSSGEVAPGGFGASASDPAVLLTGCVIPPPYERFEVARDHALPLEFDGNIVAVVEQDERGAEVTADTLLILRAAIYRTRGGKFIAEFSRDMGREVTSWGPP